MSRPERRFWLFLARTVFHCPVRLLQKRLDSQEFLEWMAEYNLEPWGDDWQQAAMISASAMAPYSKKHISYDELVPRKSKLKTKAKREYSGKEILAGYRQLQAIQQAKQNGGSRRT